MTPRNLGYRIPQQELERLTQLSRISDLLNRSLAGDDGFEQLLKTLLEMLPAERAFVLLEVGGPARIAASCSRTDKGILDDAPFEYSEVMLGAVLSLGEALLLTDASADVRYRNCERVRSTGVRSVLCVPLRGPQGYLGAVYLDNRREAGAFDRSHLEWLGIVADLAGSALERARYLSELKILVEERTRERDQAEQAALAKSAFLANMSHEIRTPMNGVLGMARLAQQCDASPVLQSYLGIIVNSAESLLDILNDILDFSKLEAGLLDYDPAPFQLRELIDSALKTVALKAHEKGLELVCSVDRRIPDRLTTDPTRLRQVLINLLGNAIKFT
ncbi:MAG: GAF domain-containing protein, partial [Armatimonadetes bacterium]|nr:GAF domain-containing protein [Armatimonadota bacterium]